MSPTENIRKIKDAAREFSLLTKQEEDILVAELNKANPKHVQYLAELFEEDPRWIVRIYEKYQIKKRAILSGDKTEWDEVIEDEIRELEEFIFND